MTRGTINGLIVSGLALLLTASLIPVEEASAAKGRKGAKADFVQTFDKDQDGRISKEEFDGPDGVFAKLDRNKDGFIDRTEQPRLQSQGKGRTADPLKEFDKDGDNRLSKEEFPGPDEHFVRFDADQDGFLERSELPQRQRRPDPISDFDRDGDSRLSLAEFPGPDDHFGLFDKNNDGFLDRNEMPPHPPRLAGPGGPGLGRSGPGRGGPDGGPGRGPGGGGDGPGQGGPGEGGPGKGDEAP